MSRKPSRLCDLRVGLDTTGSEVPVHWVVRGGRKLICGYFAESPESPIIKLGEVILHQADAPLLTSQYHSC